MITNRCKASPHTPAVAEAVVAGKEEAVVAGEKAEVVAEVNTAAGVVAAAPITVVMEAATGARLLAMGVVPVAPMARSAGTPAGVATGLAEAREPQPCLAVTSVTLLLV